MTGEIPSPIKDDVESRESGQKYTLVVHEVKDGKGVTRTYWPVLSEKVQQYCKDNSQCKITNISGSLDEALAEAARRADEEDNSGKYTSVWVETAEGHAERMPADKEFVLPKNKE